MKVTFELPLPLVKSLRSRVPSDERSRFVADAWEKKLSGSNNTLERAAKKANTLRKVSREIKDWEALNRYEASMWVNVRRLYVGENSRRQN